MRRTLKLLATVLISTATVSGVALAASKPAVSTGVTTNVGTTTAELHGAVDPNGASTTYYFEWGKSTSYGSASTSASAGSGTSPVSVYAKIGHLKPGTTYHYRLVATNSSGTTDGADHAFTTASASAHPNAAGAATGSVENLSSTGAVLTGTVSPNGNTNWYFLWGTQNNLNQQTTSVPLGFFAPIGVAWPLEGSLTPATIYQYQLVATTGPNNSIKTYGNTETFMTYPTARPYAGVHAVTTPRHRFRYPYTFTTTGTISGPSWMPAQFACIGDVTLRFYDSSHQVRFEEAPVQSNCTFSETTVFDHLPYGTTAPVGLKVVVHFQSTGYLANGRPAHDRVTIE